MARNSDGRRRESTVIRDNAVHEACDRLHSELGPLYREVSKSFIYNQIRERTGLCTKTIAYILNHTLPKRGK